LRSRKRNRRREFFEFPISHFFNHAILRFLKRAFAREHRSHWFTQPTMPAAGLLDTWYVLPIRRTLEVVNDAKADEVIPNPDLRALSYGIIQEPRISQSFLEGPCCFWVRLAGPGSYERVWLRYKLQENAKENQAYSCTYGLCAGYVSAKKIPRLWWEQSLVYRAIFEVSWVFWFFVEPSAENYSKSPSQEYDAR
jgi:hypothetical protein